MTALQIDEEMSEALRELLKKYGVRPKGTWRLMSAHNPTVDAREEMLLLPGDTYHAAEPDGRAVPLLTWRAERRFVELKRLVDEQTVAPLVMCRLARFTDGREQALPRCLYRMLDLCEWLSGKQITGLFASFGRGGCANVVCRLEADVLSSIEISGTLPAGSEPVDRHELIAGRGVACDRVVDTQVPQSSVYLISQGRTETYTDSDAELFGLSPEQVPLVRAAFRVLAAPNLADEWRRQHERLRSLVDLASTSDHLRQRLAVKGA